MKAKRVNRLMSIIDMGDTSGVAYLEINKLPYLHEIDIPKYINV
jgi:hypothetical protein